MDILKEALSMLLYAGIVALIPIVIYSFKKGADALVDYLATKTDNEVTHEVLTEIKDFVTKAVAYTMQTYVDSMKKSGKFDTESQAKAYEMAYATAVQFITTESKDLFESVYGDLSEYVRVLIESEVANLKSSGTILSIGATDETINSTVMDEKLNE